MDKVSLLREDDEEHELAVQETCIDAAVCKYSAKNKGYLPDDPFIDYFVSSKARKKFKDHLHKMPIINRGYYARVASIKQLINVYLFNKIDKLTNKVIISLGAGHDTLLFYLTKKYENFQNICSSYIEIDFFNIFTEKLSIMRKNFHIFKDIFNLTTLDEFDNCISKDKHIFQCKNYTLASCDLRNIKEVQNLINSWNIKKSSSCLVLSECVLIYMKPENSLSLIQILNEYFSQNISFLLYEQILPHDVFGQKMIDNIQKYNKCGLQSIYIYPTKDKQEERFYKLGFNSVHCWDMNEIYYKFINTEERKDKERLEMLDEVEEFHLLQSHYCIVIASKNNPLSSIVHDMITSKNKIN